MNPCRHRRLISSDSLKPSCKPRNIHPETSRQRTTFKLPRTTMHTQNMRGGDDMTYSYTFEEHAPAVYQYEKELFSRFLQTTELEWMAIVSSMSEVQPLELVNFVKIGDTVELNYENRLMAHYIGVWLMSMGYFDKHNKDRIVENVELMFDEDNGAAEVATMMYDGLFQGHLPTDLQMKALLQVCRRGWEYFTFLVCRLIKLLKRIDHINNLYIELQKAIDNR